MRFTAAQIAEIINGKTEGDPSVLVNAFGKIEEATSGQLSFLANPKYEEYLYTTGASVVLLSENLVLRKNITATLIRVKDPYQAFATLLGETRPDAVLTMEVKGIPLALMTARAFNVPLVTIRRGGRGRMSEKCSLVRLGALEVFLPDRQHWDLAVAHDVLGHAPKEDMGQAGAATGFIDRTRFHPDHMQCGGRARIFIDQYPHAIEQCPI